MGILSTIKEATDTAKKIAALPSITEVAELKLDAAELISQLADITIKSAELVEENAKLKKEVERLSKPPEFEFRDGAYWNGADGPYCPTCYDDGKEVRMQEMAEALQVLGKYRCNKCTTKIK